MQAMTHLMFQDGRAKEAAELYASLFEDAEIELVEQQGETVSVRFRLGTQRYLAFDSPIQHEFGFTPAMSIFITLDSADEVDRVFGVLADGGSELMPLGDYGFSPHFGWCVDRFGVSWQVGQQPG